VSIEDDVTRGLAELLHEKGIATWRPDTPYTASDVPITIGALPSTPDRAVALAVYGTEDDPLLADTVVMVQATIRGTSDMREADERAGRVFDLLHGRTGFTLGGVPIIAARRASWARLGLDAGGRWRRSENYYLQAHHPTTHRTF